MSRRSQAVIEEFDDDTDLPLPNRPLPNTGSKGALLQSVDSDSDDESDSDDDLKQSILKLKKKKTKQSKVKTKSKKSVEFKDLVV